MAFSFDSLCAGVLFAAAILSWRLTKDVRSGARVNLRFAAILLAALSASLMVPAAGLGFTVALLSPTLAAAALALALCFSRNAPIWFSSLALILALAAGLIAALVSSPAIALAYQAVAAGAIFVSAFSRLGENPRSGFLASAGATCLFLGAMTLMNAALGEAALFFAASLLLLTRASQAPVEEKRGHTRFFVSGKRA
jgi:hypothetical protein